jgi:hypothetical protein
MFYYSTVLGQILPEGRILGRVIQIGPTKLGKNQNSVQARSEKSAFNYISDPEAHLHKVFNTKVHYTKRLRQYWLSSMKVP